jgi:glycosyltransferase involved in cell wall biosynthesis
MHPTISVLMPVYNSERYIRVAIESVLIQTFDDFELLALDGGSADGSLAILREFESKDARLRVISKENLRLVPSLNEMIRIARGRYLARMDSDDICRPQRFERQVAYLDAHPECVAAGSTALFLDPQGMPLCECHYEPTHEEIDALHLTGIESRLCHPSVMLRRDAVINIGMYREEYCYSEDLDLFLRLAEVGRLVNLPEVLLEYRHHVRSVCYTRPDEVRRFARLAANEAQLRRGIAGTPVTSQKLEPETPAQVHRKWAWWALMAGNLKTARKHALVALTIDPFNIESLRVTACALRGR